MPNASKIIREKESFRTEAIINVDGEDVKLYAKASVNYERLTYKVQPILTLIHGFGKEVQKAIIDVLRTCRDECETRLATYREEAGIGTQGDLFGEPAAN